jgi:hypothetical protein
MLTFGIPVVAVAWFVTVPTVLSLSSFLTVVGLATGFVWVIANTYANVQPAASLAQSLHDADHAGSPAHRERNR